jgi:hypothetical protein
MMHNVIWTSSKHKERPEYKQGDVALYQRVGEYTTLETDLGYTAVMVFEAPVALDWNKDSSGTRLMLISLRSGIVWGLEGTEHRLTRLRPGSTVTMEVGKG